MGIHTEAPEDFLRCREQPHIDLEDARLTVYEDEERGDSNLC